MRTVLELLAAKSGKPKLAGLLEYSGSFERAYLLRRSLFLPHELADLMSEEEASLAASRLMTLPTLARSHEAVGPAMAKVSVLEAGWYMRNQLLRDSDWASMAHGLELRVPLVDWPLWKRVLPLRVAFPGMDKKSMARTPTRPLPDEVLTRPKTGFQVPVAQWMSDSLVSDSGVRGHLGLRAWALHVWDRWHDTLAA